MKKKKKQNPDVLDSKDEDVCKDILCEAANALELRAKGNITLFYGDLCGEEIQTLALCLASHAAYKNELGLSLLEISSLWNQAIPNFMEYIDDNLKLFIAGMSNAVALVHAASVMASCDDDLTIFSTLAPSIDEDLPGFAEESIAWQLIRDEANAIDKRVGIFLFATTDEPTLPYHKMAYADNVIHVRREDKGWSFKYVKSRSMDFGRKRFYIEEPFEMPISICKEIE